MVSCDPGVKVMRAARNGCMRLGGFVNVGASKRKQDTGSLRGCGQAKGDGYSQQKATGGGVGDVVDDYEQPCIKTFAAGC